MKSEIKTTGQARLFKNPLLELLTVSTPLESSITSISISIACIWLGYSLTPNYGVIKAISIFLTGVFAWSFFEYLLHRYLFHLSDNAFPGSKRLAYILHGVHHEYPRDASRTLMPFAPKVIFSLVFFALFYALLDTSGPFFSAGFLIGYYLYSMLHYAIHHFKAPAGFRFLWEHHLIHHHLHDDKAFGVSMPIWDKVFDTMPPRYDQKRKVVTGNSSQ
jgi:4-hydroxysphinganine ceramide fatty acyl 2-hydroxylase